MILLIGDPHFRVDNITESQKFIQEVQRCLEERQDEIDFIVVLGDILHTHEKLHTFALNSAVSFFQMLIRFKHTYCLVGNHDATSNTIFLTDNHWLNVFKGWTNLTVVDKPLWVNKVIMCPYVPDGRFQEAMQTMERPWKEASLILAHQLFDGAKMGPIVASGVEEWRPEWPMCISGHIHDKQRPQSNLFYTGSSMQHAFGESSDKTLYLYDIEKKIGEEIKLHIPRKEILYVDIQNLESIEQKVQQMTQDDIAVKIVVRGDTSEMKAAKDTTLVKRLEQTTGVKSVVFKSKTKEDPPLSELQEQKEKSTQVQQDSFESILRKMVKKKGDSYLESLLNNMLVGTEDLSDKDVFFI